MAVTAQKGLTVRHKSSSFIFRFLGRTIQFICLYDAVLAQISFEIPKQHSVLALTTPVVFFTAYFSINGLAVKNMVL